jgi:hypothetical protein
MAQGTDPFVVGVVYWTNRRMGDADGGPSG